MGREEFAFHKYHGNEAKVSESQVRSEGDQSINQSSFYVALSRTGTQLKALVSISTNKKVRIKDRMDKMKIMSGCQ